MAIKALPSLTRARLSVLQAYYGECIGNDRHRLCPNYRTCHSSFRAKWADGEFHYGQLPHIGSHYDLVRNGRPFRVAIIGPEIGAEQNWGRTLRELRDSSVRWGKGTRYPARNTHMKGTTSILRLLFGKKPGSDHEREFVKIDGKDVHVFDCYALVNFLRCSAVDGNRKTGRSTPTMRENCVSHFQQTIGVLAPTVLVLQGREVARWFHDTEMIADPIQGDGYQGQVRIAGVRSHLLALTHPSTPNRKHGWGVTPTDPYIAKTVMPAVEKLMKSIRADQ
jgi:hypothetical protein